MDRNNFQFVNEPTKEKIVEIVNLNPRISVNDLAAQLGIQSSSNIHYHIRRLMKAGRIHWLGSIRNRKNACTAAAVAKREQGLLPLPSHTREEEAALIEKVVKKAQGSGKAGEQDPGDDVVRIQRFALFRRGSIRGHRF